MASPNPRPGPLKIFISSTSEDLRLYRSAVRDATLTAGFFPMMMEYFVASGSQPPLGECLRRVSEADVLVAIVAHRYGWKPPDQPSGPPRKSITWLECEQAIRERKEVLVFLVDQDCEWPEKEREESALTQALRAGRADDELFSNTQENINSLLEFKKWLDGLGVRATFATPDELGRKVGRR